ncbi:Universal stress protein A family protein [Metarhizium anisopliae]
MATLTETKNDRFQHHVGFDNVPSGEATKNNTLSLTLNVRHKGYQARRRSRSFMVGVDEHSYSDYAIQWLLDELVDDGDEIVCVRVIEKEIRYNDKQYQEDAATVMQNILAKNASNHAISFVLEYAYCLQYSPVPVVVVRPTEKRIKKKVKRANDTTRQTYLGMLAASHGLHEADSETSSTYELEPQASPDEEAHQVAKALGLPAAFDPTIKPLRDSLLPRSRPSSPHPAVNGTPERPPLDRSPGSAGGDTEEEEEEEEEEFDVVDGMDVLNQQQKLEQLHKMEVGEAAALRKGVDDEEEEESDEAQELKEAS